MAAVRTEQEKRVRADLKIEKVFRISAAKGTGTAELKQAVIDAMPVSPAYFPPSWRTNRWERLYIQRIILLAFPDIINKNPRL